MKDFMIAAIAVMALFTSTYTYAQQKAGKPTKEKLTIEQRAQKNVEEIDKIVSLTTDQKAKVKELATVRITKADAIREKYKGQADKKEEMQKELMPVRKEFKEGLKSILSKDQLLKLREAKKAEKGKQEND
jgi:hypothetical protein